MKKSTLSQASALLITLFLCGIASESCAQTVIISQYVEACSGTTPKVIELWNPSGVDIDMSVTPIVVEKGVNGGTPATDVTINTGTLKAGEVLVVGTTDATGTTCHRYISQSFTYNGDDCLVVKLSGTITDMFGLSGNDPGTSWSGNGVQTHNSNIKLKSGITTGDVDGRTDPSIRFEEENSTCVMDGFGIPPGGCPTNDPTLTVTPVSALFTYLESGGGPSDYVEFTITGTSMGSDNATITAPSDFEVATTSGGTYQSSISISPSSGAISSNFYVRLKSSLSGGSYNDSLSITHDSVTSFKTALEGKVLSGNDTLKIASYNLLQYGGSFTDAREEAFETVVSEMDPDILTVCEVNDEVAFNEFRDSVIAIAAPHLKAGTFIDGTYQNSGLFYDSTRITFISNIAIATALRDINEYTIIHRLTGDTLRIYAVHLKASSGSSNETKRAAEVHELRKVTDALPSGSNFIAQGDFNIYDSDEPAYDSLTIVKSGIDGHFIDPITMPVTSNWNSSSNAAYHTQSTRTRSFQGGATSGLDDRFDMILYSNSLSSASRVYYKPASMVVYGNDGNHYDDSINHGSNSAVSAAIADALHDASDHLPVLAEFVFENAGVPLPVDLISFDAYALPSGEVELTWSTASESNNRGFYVQRFANNKWENIGFVEGQGESATQTDYDFLDTESPHQVLYYRLKQMEFDGPYEYSNVIVVNKLERFETLTLYPNPTYGQIRVYLEGANAKFLMHEITLSDQTGRTLYLSSFRGVDFNLDLSNYTTGFYFVTIDDRTLKVIKK